MESGHFGIEQVTEEDRAYNGSRFSEVREAVFASPYQKVWGREGELSLPHYETAIFANLYQEVWGARRCATPALL